MSDYVIIAGKERPMEVQRGTLEKGLGQTVIKGEKGMSIARRGSCIIPNRTQVWGQRVINGKPNEDSSPIQVTDPKYKGEIKFLKRGTDGGTWIDSRYIKGLNSLDMQYQEIVLRYKVDENNEASAEAAFITLQSGDNVIEEKTDPLLVEHLKAHSFNRDSKSKSETAYSFMFYEKNFEQVQQESTKVFDDKFEAMKIVNEASSTIGSLKTLFTIVKEVADESPEDDKLLSYLKMLANNKGTEFLKEVANYKLIISDTHTKAMSFDAIDVSVNGVIATNQAIPKVCKKGEIIMNDVPAKGEDMLQYLYDNFTAVQVFEAEFKIKQITDKLK